MLELKMNLRLFIFTLVLHLTRGSVITHAYGGCKPPNIRNGDIRPKVLDGEFFPAEASLKVRCYDGFVLQGVSRITCNNDGTWSHNIPTCEETKRVECPPPILKHGSVSPLLPTFIPYDTGMRVEFTCDTGFVLQGEKELVCTEKGEWSFDLPMCHSNQENSQGCQPQTLENGKVTPGPAYGAQTYSKGSAIFFSCNDGFFLLGVESIMCMSEGKWSSTLPICEITCERPTISKGKLVPDLSGLPYIASVSVTFYCEKGFSLIGQQTSTCLKTGKWSSPIPTCRSTVRETVPTFPTVPHLLDGCRLPSFPFGSVTPRLFNDQQDYTTGSVVTFSCRPGRVLVGKPAIECLSANTWSDPAPTCEVGCENIQIDNGNVQPRFESYDEYFTPGVTALIKCQSGYVLVGEGSVVCQSNGRWSKSLPLCVESRQFEENNKRLELEIVETTVRPITEKIRVLELICPKPIVRYGIIISDDDLTELPIGATVFFGCHPGYVLRGPGSLKCLDDGKWNAPIPECVVGCETPILDYGHVSPDFTFSEDYFQPMMTASFSCLPGYRVQGPRVIACSERGQWSDMPPTCKSVSTIEFDIEIEGNCKKPSIREGSFFPVYDSYPVSESIVFACNPGYRRTGETRATCLEGGIWSVNPPVCSIGCATPTISGGKFSPKLKGGDRFYNTGTEVEFKCDKSKALQGSAIIYCQQDGTWDSAFPTCKDKCPQPFLKHGRSRPRAGRDGFSPNVEVTFECDSGYELRGPRSATCVDGDWVPKNAECIYIKSVENSMEDPDVKDDSYFSTRMFTSRYITTTVRPTTQTTTERTTTTRWQPQTTRSTTRRWQPETTRSTTTRWQPPATTTKRVIIPTTQWRPTERPVPGASCAIPIVYNGMVGTYQPGNKVPAGSKVTVKCKSGYVARGFATVTCSPAGKWLSLFPICASMLGFCMQPQEVKHGRFSPMQKQYRAGSKVSFYCNDGHKMVGARTAYCQRNGKFTASPVCQPLRIEANKGGINQVISISQQQCRVPKVPTNGMLKPYRQVYAARDEIQYFCQVGYKLVGETRSICAAVRGWDSKPPTCEKIKCIPAREPVNGFIVNKREYYYGDKVEYDCIENHILIGNRDITCGANAQYSGPPPACKPPSCQEECTFVHGRSCQCDITCRWSKGNCCADFEQYCRKLYYK